MKMYIHKKSVDAFYVAFASFNIALSYFLIEYNLNQRGNIQIEFLDMFLNWLRSSAILFCAVITAALFLMILNWKALKRSLRFSSGVFEDASIFFVSTMPILAKYWIIIGSLGLSIFMIDNPIKNNYLKFNDNSNFYIILINILTVFLVSFIGYLSHRLMHSSIAWPLHRIHHESRSFNILTKFRFNPFELIVIIPLGCLFLLEADKIFAVKLYYSWRIFHEVAIHSHYAWRFSTFLGFVIVSANDHRNHHSRHMQLSTGQNFSTDFIFWDRLFMTYKISNSKFFPIGLNGVGLMNRFIYIRMLFDLKEFIIRLYKSFIK